MSAFVGCNACATRSGGKADLTPRPDTSRTIRVVGRWATASACPVSQHVVITAAHVVDPRPFDPQTPYSDVIFQQGDLVGRLAVASVFHPPSEDAPQGSREWLVSRNRDLAWMETDADLLGWYPIATNAPAVGSTVYFFGFDWRSKRSSLR
jgi:hypothetical protein